MLERGTTVVGKDGWRGAIETALLLEGSEPRVLVQLYRDGQEVLVPSRVLEGQADGSYYVPLDLAELDYQDLNHDEPVAGSSDAGGFAGSVLLYEVDAQGRWKLVV